jgi:dihydroorotase
MSAPPQSSARRTRRDFLADLARGAACAAAPFGALQSLASAPSAARMNEKPYDLVIRGGRVIDPAQKLDAVRDVAVRDGKIAAIEPEIPAAPARKVLSAAGRLVTPGLIDLHTHVFPYVGPFGIDPDPYFVHRGTTTALDAGTSGAHSFAGFRRTNIERAETRVRALLHVVSIGLVAGNTENMGELLDLRYCDPKLAAKVAGENRDVIVGFKIRFSDFLTGANDLEGLRRARAAADEAALPLMAHIGGPHSPLGELLKLMKKGDVVTHTFNPRRPGILDDAGKLRPEVLEARARGVVFDVGHGAGSFSFDVMERALDQGFRPDTISTDLHAFNIHGPVFDLPTTLSKFLLLGFSLNDVIEKSTVRAARAFDFGARIGTLEPGAEADLAVFDLREGEFTFTDVEKQTRTGRQMLVPVATVRAGKVFKPVQPAAA